MVRKDTMKGNDTMEFEGIFPKVTLFDGLFEYARFNVIRVKPSELQPRMKSFPSVRMCNIIFRAYKVERSKLVNHKQIT